MNRLGRRRVLYSQLKGRRFTIYIPEDLVPKVRRCLDNRRAPQELPFEAAPRYIKLGDRPLEARRLPLPVPFVGPR